MAELKDFVGSVAVVVSSCDAFFDVWRPFAFFFRKFWRACPYQVFLIVNELPVRSAFFTPITVGTDRGWATNLKTTLEKITEPYMLYMQEDYFLTASVNETQLAADISEAMRLGADSLCLRSRSDLEPAFQPLNERFGVVPRESDGRTRCQITLWNRNKLLSILREGETAWEMESRGSERTREMLILSYARRENTPIPYLMSAIVRGLWMPNALAFCQEHGVSIAPRFRPAYSGNSLLRRIRRWSVRRRLASELSKRKAQPIDLDSGI